MSLEVVAHSYNELLKVIETLQQQGKFSLPEASAIYSQLISMKSGIEESHKQSGPGSSSDSSEEVEDLKVTLMSTKIENDNLKRNYQEAMERIEELTKTPSDNQQSK